MGKTLLSDMCGRAFAIIRASHGWSGVTGEVDLGSMMGHRSTLS